MVCAILELDLRKKKKWYTWIVGHLLNQENSSKVNRVSSEEPTVQMLFNYKLRCSCMEDVDWQTQRAGLWTGEQSGVQIPTFAKLYLGTVGFIFIFCSCVIYRCLNTCKNNPHMFHFKLFALFWYCNTSNGAQRTREGGHPGEQCSKTPLTMEKGAHTNSVPRFWAEHNSFSAKTRNSWKVANLEMISRISPPTQANNE